MRQSRFPDGETAYGPQWIAPLSTKAPPNVKKFRLHGASLFLAGLELWYYAQLYWFSGSFRLQALGVVLLVYWILGGLFLTRQPAEEPHPDPS